jgi:hypothetical protein
LTAETGFLSMQIGDHHAPVVPLSDTDFLERYFFGQMAISKDAEGRVTGLTCRYGKKSFVARRLESH